MVIILIKPEKDMWVLKRARLSTKVANKSIIDPEEITAYAMLNVRPNIFSVQRDDNYKGIGYIIYFLLLQLLLLRTRTTMNVELLQRKSGTENYSDLQTK